MNVQSFLRFLPVSCRNPICGRTVRRLSAMNVLGPDDEWLVCCAVCYRAELRRLRKILAIHGT